MIICFVMGKSILLLGAASRTTNMMLALAGVLGIPVGELLSGHSEYHWIDDWEDSLRYQMEQPYRQSGCAIGE